MRRQCGFHQFGVHPSQPVAVLHHDHGGRRVGQQSARPGPGAVHPGSDLGLDPDHRQVGLYRPRRQAGDLPVQVSPLVMGGYPRIKACPALREGPAAVSGDTKISRHLLRRDGSLPSRYQRYAVVTWMPCACAHSVRFTLQVYYLEHVFAI